MLYYETGLQNQICIYFVVLFMHMPQLGIKTFLDSYPESN